MCGEAVRQDASQACIETLSEGAFAETPEEAPLPTVARGKRDTGFVGGGEPPQAGNPGKGGRGRGEEEISGIHQKRTGKSLKSGHQKAQ